MSSSSFKCDGETLKIIEDWMMDYSSRCSDAGCVANWRGLFLGKESNPIHFQSLLGRMGDKRRNIIVPDDVLMLQKVKKKNTFIEKF